MRPYRVKAGRQVDKDGISYLPGQIVYLTSEEAYFHRLSVELEQGAGSGSPVPPFYEALTAYKGADFYQKWFLEQYAVEISSATAGSGVTTLVCAEPHLLSSGVAVTVRIVMGPTLVQEFFTSATVVDAVTVTVPVVIALPSNRESAELSLPINLLGSTIDGGIFAYLPETEQTTLVATAFTTLNSNRVRVVSRDLEEAGRINVGDRVKITGAFAANTACVGKSDVVSFTTQQHEAAYVLAGNATATVETNEIFVEKDVPPSDMGALTKSFVVSGNFTYGELAVQLQSTDLATLAEGIYPFQIFQRVGTVDTLLFRGTLEVIA